jgi:Lon protease-like protein
MAVIPLFPLNLVLFPSVPLPLHIFEERYREMIQRCIEESIPFGVVYHKGESMETIGCSAVVQEVIKRYDDGRLDILSVGGERFEIESLDKSGLYLEATVRYLPDDGECSDDSLAKDAVNEILKYAFYAEVALDRTTLATLRPTQLAFLIAGIDVIGMESKQELLTLNDPDERLKTAVEKLRHANRQLMAAAQLKKVTGTDIDLSGLMN